MKDVLLNVTKVVFFLVGLTFVVVLKELLIAWRLA